MISSASKMFNVKVQIEDASGKIIHFDGIASEFQIIEGPFSTEFKIEGTVSKGEEITPPIPSYRLPYTLHTDYSAELTKPPEKPRIDCILATPGVDGFIVRTTDSMNYTVTHEEAEVIRSLPHEEAYKFLTEIHEKKAAHSIDFEEAMFMLRNVDGNIEVYDSSKESLWEAFPRIFDDAAKEEVKKIVEHAYSKLASPPHSVLPDLPVVPDSSYGGYGLPYRVKLEKPAYLIATT